MKRSIAAIFLSFLGLVGIMALSSFYQPNPEAKPDIKYRGQSKQTSSSGLIKLSVGLQNDYYTANNTEGYYYVEIVADQYRNQHYQRPPLNLSIVLDRSGSMSGDKIRNAKKAASYLVDQLNENDFISVIVYDQEVTTLHHQSPVSNKAEIKRKIDNIYDRGSTNLMGGAMRGYEEVQQYYRSGYINRVLLLSDGLANEGITDPQRINRIVQDKFRQQNIAISTFGVGSDYNEDLMTSMAENGNGNYYFIQRPSDIADIFRKELNGLMEVVAQNSQLQITIPNNVQVLKVYGYSHIQQGNQVSIKLNDIFSNETKGILMKYRINNTQLPNQLPFYTRLDYRNTTNEKNAVLAVRNIQQFTNSETIYNEYFSEWVEAQVVLQETNHKMEVAMKAIDRGEYDKGKNIVKETQEFLSSRPALIKQSAELQRAQSANQLYDTEIQNIESISEDQKKIIQKSNKSVNYQIRRKK